MGLDPVWRKAPFVLWRFPQILLAVALGALLLGIASAAGPAFLSSSAAASLSDEIERAGRWGAGLRVARSGPLFGRDRRGSFAETTQERTRALDRAVSAIPHVGEGVVTLTAQLLSLDAVESGNTSETTLVARTTALEHVRMLERAGADGLSIADLTARELGVAAGDTLELGLAGRSLRVPVAGVYRALALDRPRAFWSPLGDLIYRTQPSDDTLPPPLTIVPAELFFRVAQQLRLEGMVRWEYALDARPLSLAAARKTAAGFGEINGELSSSTSALGRLFEGGGWTGGGTLRLQPLVLPGLVATATERVQSSREPVELLSLATRAVTLTVLGAAGFYLVQRRRVEWVLLASRGRGPLHLGLKAACEALAPLLVCAFLGAAAGGLVVLSFGPSSVLSAGAVEDAARATATGVALGAAVIVLVVASTIAREEGLLQERIAALSRVWWELPVLLVAGLATARVAATEDIVVRSGGVPTVDRAVVFLPILLILAGAGLVTRGLRVLLQRLDRASANDSSAFYLAVRRLSRSPKLVVVLLTACAFSIGVLVFAGALASSVESTATAKAKVFTGSDWSGIVPVNSETPARFPFAATRVIRVNQATASPGDVSVMMVGVDVESFAEAAYWDPAFSDRSLQDLLRALDAGGSRLRVLVAGEHPPEVDALSYGGEELPVAVVETLEAFPGVTSDRPLVVATDEALESALATLGSSVSGRSEELWVKGDPGRIMAAARRAGLLIGAVTVAEDVIRTPALQSLLWTLQLLEALAMGAGMIAIVGLLLYLQARQRAVVLARALTRRMGMSARSQLLSGSLEVAGMLGTCLVVGGALALGVALATHERFDLRPTLLPAPLLRVPLGLLVATACCVVVVAAAAAVWIARAADRANVAEVLRSSE